MRILFLLTLYLFVSQSFAQTDTTESKSSIAKKALEEGLSLIKRSNRDSTLVEKSEEKFIPFENKIIREIYIENVGFEKAVFSTEKPITKKIGRLANNLHTNTRDKTIRQHLFIRKNERVNPYKIADNERLIREKDFILDSRIVITPVEGTDSVDITIVTRDVFSIGASAGGSFPSAPEIGFYDANIDGRGQRFQVNFLFDQDRNPKTGLGLSYLKSSFLGSFVDIELFYTQLNEGLSRGEEIEYATGFRFNRPLISPYSRLAGGGEWSRNWSKNIYSRPDSSFLDYSYNVSDIWLGYNFGINKKETNRKRSFLALRLFEGFYTKSPENEGILRDRVYSNSTGILGSYTFYETDYFKTQYILGFGRTEDVPVGNSLTTTLGHISILSTDRPYAGVELKRSAAFKSGAFYQLEVAGSSYFRNSGFEDAVASANFTFYTQAFQMGKFKLRNVARLGHSELFNIFSNDWLQLDPSILAGLRTRQYEATSRTVFSISSTLYTPWSVLGFRIAPFSEYGWARMKCESCEKKINYFMSVSAGMRIRNENLIFGTMELKVSYLPQDEFGESRFKFTFRQNLRFRRTEQLVYAPSIFSYNN